MTAIAARHKDSAVVILTKKDDRPQFGGRSVSRIMRDRVNAEQ